MSHTSHHMHIDHDTIAIQYEKNPMILLQNNLEPKSFGW